MAPNMMISLLLLLVFSSGVVEPRNVAFVHCNNDNDCDFICRNDFNKFEPFCHKHLCVCDKRRFCTKDLYCRLTFPCYDKDSECIAYTCQCPLNPPMNA
ncbi:hypothetical protein P3L10_014182 [Capsicum annuum]